MSDIKEIPEYQKRVITEAEELKTKIDALDAYLSTDKCLTLSDDQFLLMSEQLELMKLYHGILLDRINLF